MRSPQEVARPAGCAEFSTYFLVRRVACGRAHTVAIDYFGRLWGWGANDHGQLALPKSNKQFLLPQRVSPDNVISTDVFCGADETFLCTSNGALCFGANANGRLGVGGDGTDAEVPCPLKLGDGSDPVMISSRGGHTLALNAAGDLWAWGSNLRGQLGIDDTRAQARPVRVSYFANGSVVAASAGELFSVALDKDYKLWCWGQGGHPNPTVPPGDNSQSASLSTPVAIDVAALAQ